LLAERGLLDEFVEGIEKDTLEIKGSA